MRMSRSSTRPAQHGSGRFAALILLGLLALAAVVAAMLWQRGEADRAVPARTITASPPPAIDSSNRAPPATRDDGSTQALLRAARAAVAARQLLAPAGASAFEHYLDVLHDQPDEPVATEALRELFPFAAEQAAGVIRDGDIDEAQREIDLLARADPANYTLTLLRNQLAERQRTASLAAAPAAVSRDAADPRPTAAESPPVAAAKRVAPPTPVPVVGARPSRGVVAATTPTAPTPAVLLRRVEPYYPQAARRSRREGWVELQFVVTADGHVSNVRVLDAAPSRVFDLAASNAVQRWVFAPATRAGRAVETTLRQRLDFRL
ncbi:energy transducer TonB [Dyella sp.]|uniref:energy transducer TonB n=1 Tax=Dyella sp. TaxID=1869338 RepID=UPI002D793377|nr:energy transducer TonB [Dyella sp.]HET6433991.1 energy transducer TonB [Dyella sp.]